MKIDRYISRICIAIVLFAVLVRLLIGILVPSASAFRKPQANDLLLYGATTNLIKDPAGGGNGMQPKPSSPNGSISDTGIPSTPLSTGSTGGEATIPGSTSSAPTTTPTTAPTTTPTTRPTQPTTQPTDPPAQSNPPRPGIIAFTKADMQYVSVSYGSCPKRPDIAGLLQQRLELDLVGSEPTVLIIHSHATECYTKGPGEEFDCHAQFRSKDTNYNMVSIGDALAELLEAAGIQVVHDRTLHDYMNYDGAYDSSRKSVEEYLKQYPTIQIVLDLHRDALQNSDGSWYAPLTKINGEDAAQLMLVMGTNVNAQHPCWQDNLSFALKLHALMQKEAPGLMRSINMRNGRYNQDLSTGYVLIECGSAGNTHAQVLRSMPVLANAIIALVNGAN